MNHDKKQLVSGHNRLIEGMIVPLEDEHRRRLRNDPSDPKLPELTTGLGKLKDAQGRADKIDLDATPYDVIKRQLDASVKELAAIATQLAIYKAQQDRHEAESSQRWGEQRTQNAMFAEADLSLHDRVSTVENKLNSKEKFPLIPLILGAIAGIIVGVLWKMKVFKDTINVFGANINYTYGPANEAWYAWLIGIACGGIVFGILWVVLPSGRKTRRSTTHATAPATPSHQPPTTQPMATVARGGRERN